ncbi:MAG: N-acetylmuramate alpha-1-phosphate uridylyltransferase MurU [Luteimonas sp.]
MKALVFSAGLGERMRPLTNLTPKPLLLAGGKPLIAWHLEKLAAIGVRDVVINTSWLAPQFPRVLGDGSQWGLHLHFLHEGHEALETGGGMHNALALLAGNDDAPFIAINGDIWCDYDFARLPSSPRGDAHLVLVDNPPQHPHGDFVLCASGSVVDAGADKLTFAGIGVYRSALLRDWRATIGDAPGSQRQPPRFPITPLLRAAMARNAVTGEHHCGRWTDVGTPDRLARLDAELA